MECEVEVHGDTSEAVFSAGGRDLHGKHFMDGDISAFKTRARLLPVRALV